MRVLIQINIDQSGINIGISHMREIQTDTNWCRPLSQNCVNTSMGACHIMNIVQELGVLLPGKDQKIWRKLTSVNGIQGEIFSLKLCFQGAWENTLTMSIPNGHFWSGFTFGIGIWHFGILEGLHKPGEWGMC